MVDVFPQSKRFSPHNPDSGSFSGRVNVGTATASPKAQNYGIDSDDNVRQALRKEIEKNIRLSHANSILRAQMAEVLDEYRNAALQVAATQRSVEKQKESVAETMAWNAKALMHEIDSLREQLRNQSKENEALRCKLAESEGLNAKLCEKVNELASMLENKGKMSVTPADATRTPTTNSTSPPTVVPPATVSGGEPPTGQPRDRESPVDWMQRPFPSLQSDEQPIVHYFNPKEFREQSPSVETMASLRPMMRMVEELEKYRQGVVADSAKKESSSTYFTLPPIIPHLRYIYNSFGGQHAADGRRPFHLPTLKLLVEAASPPLEPSKPSTNLLAVENPRLYLPEKAAGSILTVSDRERHLETIGAQAAELEKMAKGKPQLSTALLKLKRIEGRNEVLKHQLATLIAERAARETELQAMGATYVNVWKEKASEALSHAEQWKRPS